MLACALLAAGSLVPPAAAGDVFFGVFVSAEGGVRRVGQYLETRFNELCFGRPDYLSASEEPLLVSIAANPRHAVLAAALPPAATVLRLRLRLQGQSPRRIGAPLISRQAAARSGLRRFRLVALPLPADACIDELATLDRRRRSLAKRLRRLRALASPTGRELHPPPPRWSMQSSSAR